LLTLQIINTIRPEFFSINIRESVLRRQAVVEGEKDVGIYIQPELLNLIKNTGCISKSKTQFSLVYRSKGQGCKFAKGKY